MIINAYTLSPLVSAILFAILGIVVYSSSSKKQITVPFSLLCFATTWWQFSWFVIFNLQSVEIAQIVAKIGYSGIVFIPLLFYVFFAYFFDEQERQNNQILFFVGYAVGLIIMLWGGEKIISGVFNYSWGYYPQAGEWFWLYLIFIGLMMIKTIRILIREIIKSRKTLNKSRFRQSEFLLLGLLIYSVASLDFLANYGYDMYPIGFFFVLSFLGIITYSIVKDNLMNVKVFMTKLVALFIVSFAFVNIFFSRNAQELTFEIIYFVAITILSFLIVRSVKKEVQQKEELLKLSNELRRANTELTRLDKAKSEFISIASHQLRTPLTAIKGYISLILEGAYGKNADKTDDALNKIFLANERLIQLVEDLLNITRIESGRLELHLEDNVQVEDIVEELRDMFILRAQDKKLDFVVKTPDKVLPPVRADRSKLREVISNLIDNAIKYTKEGFIHVSMEEEKGMVRVIVEDSGMGISEDSMKTLFTKFSRGTDSAKIYTEGTGLGLYVGKNLVESQGGRIYAESDGVNKGSRFIVEMPVQKKKKK